MSLGSLPMEFPLISTLLDAAPNFGLRAQESITREVTGMGAAPGLVGPHLRAEHRAEPGRRAFLCCNCSRPSVALLVKRPMAGKCRRPPDVRSRCRKSTT